ncbi:hypothetical protein BJ912DRAFT_853245 [Pholiota molesta]|nr:hypothetical protein BJ912DRAFT_853245 [Pholiota molesta]
MQSREPTPPNATVNSDASTAGCIENVQLDGGVRYSTTQKRGLPCLPKRGGVAYAAQETWLLNDSIRNNILFGASYGEQRHRIVLQQCALEPDLALFAAGDATTVGKRDATLSWGQKARITLAQAVYAHAEMLLLYVVFAALECVFSCACFQT